jgi:hypothetical protein
VWSRPVESGTDDAYRRDMEAGPFPLSAARRGTRLTPAGSAPISMARYIEKVGDLALDVPTVVGLRGGREFGADPASRHIGPPDPLTHGEFVQQFGPMSGLHVDSAEHSAAAAAIRDSRADAIAIDGGRLECLTASSSASARMVSGYRPTRHEGDLMFPTAAQEPDGSAKNDPGTAARRWHPHVNGSIYTHALGAPNDVTTAPEVLPGIAAVLERRQKVDRPRLRARCLEQPIPRQRTQMTRTIGAWR